jgi:hypothetical protein
LGVTVAVKLTDWPKLLGFTVDESVVVVPSLVTT